MSHRRTAGQSTSPPTEGLSNLDVAEAFLQTNPGIASHSASRALRKKYPGRWLSDNAARCCVRHLRGSIGNYHRNTARSVSHSLASYENPWGLPEPVLVPYEPCEIEGERMLVLSDIHIPFHCVESLTLALQEGQRFNPEAILINGDLFDFHRLSAFVKEPEARKVIEDLESGYKLFQVIRKKFPRARVYYKWGNHDEWFSIYIKARAPELADLPGLQLDQQIWYDGKTLADLGVETIKDQRKVFLGKLPVLHGHEIRMKNVSVNPARTAFLKCQDSVLVGHLHKDSQHSETNIHGKLVTTWSTGCLCQLHPKFARINQWGNGFALVEVDKEGAFSVQTKRIYKSKVW